MRRRLLLRWLVLVAVVWVVGLLPWSAAVEARRFGAALLLVGPWLPLLFDSTLQVRRGRWSELAWRLALVGVAGAALL